jgi:hypothetical protein
VRDTLLLSHANPEDNEFTLWLALQLANEGYRVWCDLTKLLGGEVFWDDIEAVIRTRTAKVLYVLSRTSNGKDGPLRELQLAQSLARKEGIQDFVIPLHIDDLPYGEVTIELTRVNATPFENSWAQGLATLLKKLEEDGVPKDPSFNRAAVNGWWRSQFSGTQDLREEPEIVFSNWFKVEDLPSTLYEHNISRHQPGLVDFGSQPLPYPGVWLDPLSILTFAAESDLEDYLSPSFFVEQSRPILLDDFIAGRDSLADGPKFLAQLIRLAWDRAIQAKLSTYEGADARMYYYFKKGTVADDTVSFIGANGKKSHRGVVGYKTLIGRKLRYWHYALSAKPVIRPETLFLVKGHVLFSDDGFSLWTNKDQMAKARRNQCKNWWNDEWRDRMYATMSYLADSGETVLFPLGATARFSVSKQPIQFESPVSYLEPGEVVKDDDLGDYDFEDEDADDEAVTAEDEPE